MLTVYKASAGSGKTFRLATEYIKRLIVSPLGFDRILAVTFTNKATEEMKMRIMSQLYGIAHDLESSKAYSDIIIEELQEENAKSHFTDEEIDKDFVKRRAKMAMHNLLHNYTFFRVETIDRFFQTVLRNLARELDLTPNLRIELADKEIEHEAVDMWIDGLKENDKELSWILDYIRSTMDEEKAWNIIDKIKQFGEQLLKDEYKECSDELAASLSDDAYTAYSAQLREMMRQASQIVHEEGKKLCNLIESHGYDAASFAQGARGVGGFIYKMRDSRLGELKPNSYVLKALDPDDTEATAWCKKTSSPALKSFCRDTLKHAFTEAMETFGRQASLEGSARITLNHLSKLRMLQAIQAEITRNNRETNRFLLSDTQQLLTKMIDGSDSPFIYEKTGCRLHNIMIDEFQDTSSVQWRNFKVLLADCMSHGHDNLIVGDVKQSIYRWRSGDWRLLNDIESEFAGNTVDVHSLTTNRRSATRVIQFNNTFFARAADNLYETAKEKTGDDYAEKLRRAYSDVAQEYPPGKEESGYVEYHAFVKEDYEEATLRYISDTVARLIHAGKTQSDIAVLVRSNRLIPVIVRHCLSAFAASGEPALCAIRFISDEAFLLGASSATGIITDAMQLLLTPDDAITAARLSVAYQRDVLKDTAPLSSLIASQKLPPQYLSRKHELLAMPLYQMCEEICNIFSICEIEEQSAYVCAFFDLLSEYIQNNISDVKSFLTYWNDIKNRRYIEADGSNGIRILTIHKSKGLEYDSVIIPFCEWEMLGARHKPLLWCRPQEAPFNEMPVIPIDFDATMTNTIYEPYYRDEYMQTCVDNLNLLYVAFTRAKENLFITTQTGQKENYRGCIFDLIMPDVRKQLNMNENEGTASLGQLKAAGAAEGGASGQASARYAEEAGGAGQNVFLVPSTPLRIKIQNTATQPEFKESTQSKLFSLPDGENDIALTDINNRLEYIRQGNILHLILQHTRAIDDLDGVIRKFEMQGVLEMSDILGNRLRQNIMRCMQNETVRDWFSPRWRLYNECNILEYDSAEDRYVEHRPDRVMTDGKETIVVDFKLCSLKDEYFAQVREYASLLRRLGFPDVKGFIWLVIPNKVVSVN